MEIIKVNKPMRIQDCFIEPVFDIVIGDPYLAVTHVGEGTRFINKLPHDDKTYIPNEYPFGIVTSPIVAAGTLPPAIDAQKLRVKLAEFIVQYFAGTEQIVKAMAAFALNSWVYDFAPSCRSLAILGDHITGKTTALQTLRWICYRSGFANAMMSIDTLVKCINLYGGTWLFDEEIGPLISRIIKVRGTSTESNVIQMADNGPQIYNVYGPSAITLRSSRLLGDPSFSKMFEIVKLEQAPANAISTRRIVEREQIEHDAMALWPELLAYRLNVISKKGK